MVATAALGAYESMYDRGDFECGATPYNWNRLLHFTGLIAVRCLRYDAVCCSIASCYALQ